MTNKPLPTPAQLAAALAQVADEFTIAPPPEILRIFPSWTAELPEVLRNQGASELAQSLHGIELQQAAQDPGSAIAYAFAKNALSAALDVHEGARFAQGEGARCAAAHSGRGLVISSTRDAFVTSTRGYGSQTWEIDLDAMVDEATRRAPVLVRNAFSNFDADLASLLKRPLPELRAAVARLETVHADLEIRRFTEDALYPDTASSIEATALGYTVQALHAVVGKRSAAAIARRMAMKVSTSLPAQPIEQLASERRTTGASATDSSGSQSSSFKFQSLYEDETSRTAPGDAFNPCCGEWAAETMDVDSVTFRKASEDMSPWLLSEPFAPALPGFDANAEWQHARGQQDLDATLSFGLLYSESKGRASRRDSIESTGFTAALE